MWLFTKYGFFSVVCARQGDGRSDRPIDQDRLMVRARLRDHLHALKERWPGELGSCDIQTFAGSDYAFRIFVAKPVWAGIASQLVLETDYDNFKSAVARHQGAAGKRYGRALGEVWAVMLALGRRSSSNAASPQVLNE